MREPNPSGTNTEKAFDDMNFEDFFVKRTSSLAREADYNGRRRLAMAILMNKRNRGDMFGFIPEYDDYSEIEYIPVTETGLMKWQIFEPIVRANNANALNVKMDYVWEAATNDPDAEAGAEFANALTQHLRQRFYTESKREGMCELAQLSHAFFLYADFDEKRASFPIRRPKTRRIETPVGYEIYVCDNCGYSASVDEVNSNRELEGQQMADDARNQIASMVTPEMEQEVEAATGGVPPGALLDAILKQEQKAYQNQEATCPDCGSMMNIEGSVEMQQVEVPDGFEEVYAGDFDDRLVSSLEMLVDERHARRGDLSDAHWICYRPLTPYYELERRYANCLSDIKHQTEADWSDATQWLRALETSGDLVRRFNTDLIGIDRLFELEWWWFTPEACGSWKEPEGWELKDDEGTVLFDIKRGETVRDACMRRFGRFDGLRIEKLDNRILRVETQNLRDHWSSGHWLVNANSFWGKGLESLLDLQTMVNEFINMMYEHCAHSSMPHRIIDGMMFDGDDFENRPGHVSYTRPGFIRDKPIDFFIKDLTPPAMGGEVFSLFSYILGPGKQDVSGVTAGSVGTSDPNVKTARGQSMVIQRALGLETPYFKAEKQAVRAWLTNLVRLFQRHMPPEAYQYIKAPNGEEMKATDIELFKNLQIGQDIVLRDVEGTDIPQTHIEMRENYALALQLGLFAPPELSGIPPEVQTKMLKMLRIEYDPANYSDQRRAAYSRLKVFKEEAEARLEEAMLPDGSIDQNLIQEILLSVPFLPRQDAHLVHIGVLDAYCVAESVRERPNPLLMALLQGRALQHQQAIQGMQREAAMQQALAAGAAQKLQGEASGEAEEKERQREDTKAREERADAKERRASAESADRDMLSQILALVDSERQREHESMERDLDRQAAAVQG